MRSTSSGYCCFRDEAPSVHKGGDFLANASALPGFVARTRRIGDGENSSISGNYDHDRPGTPHYARWRKDWVEASSELAQDRRDWGVSTRNVVNSIGDAG